MKRRSVHVLDMREQETRQARQEMRSNVTEQETRLDMRSTINERETSEILYLHQTQATSENFHEQTASGGSWVTQLEKHNTFNAHSMNYNQCISNHIFFLYSCVATLPAAKSWHFQGPNQTRRKGTFSNGDAFFSISMHSFFLEVNFAKRG